MATCRFDFDVSEMYDVKPDAKHVQDLLAHIHKVMNWPLDVRVVDHNVRRSRIQMREDKSFVYLYNLSVSVFHPICPKSAEPMVVEWWIDLLWCGYDDVKLLYAEKEKRAWRVPLEFNTATEGTLWQGASTY